jgi:hypothetical protein
MAVRSKTVADAIERIEDLEAVFGKHVGKFEAHVEKQQGFNESITARVVDAEKADITIGAKLDTIIAQLTNKRIGWQIWLPFGVTALMSFAALMIQIWPKGANP